MDEMNKIDTKKDNKIQKDKKSTLNSRVIHWNAFKLTNARVAELKLFLHSNQPDVVAIQECKLNEEEASLYLQFQDYKLHYASRPKNPTKGGGIAILVNNRLNSFTISSDYSENNFEMLHVKIDLDLPINIISLYITPNIKNGTKKKEDSLKNLLIKLPKVHSILIGDFNAKSLAFGHQHSNENGWFIDELVLNSDLIHISDDSRVSTYYRFGTNDNDILDYVFCSQDLAVKVNDYLVAVEHSMSSDHAPVIVDFIFSNPYYKSTSATNVNLNVNKIDWFKYKDNLSSKFAPFWCSNDVNELNGIFSNIIVNEASQLSPSSKPKNSRSSLPKYIIEWIKFKEVSTNQITFRKRNRS